MTPLQSQADTVSWFEGTSTWASQALPNLIAAALILIVGYWLSGLLARQVGRLVDNLEHIDPTLKGVFMAVVRYAIIIIVLVAALGQLGVQTTSILAVLGAAGLAIGLALQGTLANVAAGLDIGAAHTVVVKSRGHFRTGFLPWFPPEQVLEIDTGGLTSPVLHRRQWSNLPRPAYPLDEDASWSPPS